MDRRQLIAAIEVVEREVAAWRDAPQPVISPFSGELVTKPQNFPAGVVQALDALQAVVDADEFPSDARRIVLAADELLAEARARKSGAIWGWKSYQDLLGSRQTPVSRQIETPQQLAAQGVGHRQIAKMLQWVDWRGEPDSARVAEELRTPGTHFHTATFVHPLDVRDAIELDHRWADRVQHRADARKLPEQAVTPPARPTRRESLDELIEQGVGARQIGKMVGLSESDVRTRMELVGWAEEELPRPRTGLSSVMRSNHAADERTKKAYQLLRVDTHPELNSWPLRIAAMREDGLDDRTIADALQHRHEFSLSHAWALVRPVARAQ